MRVGEYIAADQPKEVSEKDISKEVEQEVTQETESTEKEEVKEEAPPPHQANLKYKVYDEEKEFPTFVHALITDKEKEAHFRETYGKAGAFDSLKSKFEETRKERDEHVGELNKYKNAVQGLYHHAQKDLDRFFEEADVKPERVIDWVSNRLKRDELPPEDRRVYDEEQRLRRENFDINNQLKGSKSENTQIMQRLHSIEMDQAMGTQETHEFSKQFDSIRGPGSFRKAVDQYGEYRALQKQYVRPTEAVRHVLDENKWLLQYQKPADNSPPPASLPNLGPGRGVSPVKKKITSIEGYKQHYKEKYGG